MPTIMNPNALTIALFIISFLLTALLALLGFFGIGINRRFEAVSAKFNIVFKELEKYQEEKICKILMSVEKERIEKTEGDINKLGGKVDKMKRAQDN